MKKENNRFLDPTKNDIFYYLINHLVGNNPFVLAIAYFFIAFGGTLILGFATGHLYGGYSKLVPISEDYMNIFNVGILAPIGAGFLANLYRKIQDVFFYLKNDKIIIENEDEFDSFVERLELIYTNKYIMLLAIIISLYFNAYGMFKREAWWCGIHGGITAYYFRAVVGVNYFMIVMILYKCMVTVWALRQIFKFKIRLQPLHPDKCGGLKPIGSLSIAIHYFLQVIIFFLTSLLIFNPNNLHNAIFVFGFTGAILFTGLSLFLSLGEAHGIMKRAKEELLHKLNMEFQTYYDSLIKSFADRVFKINTAVNIEVMNNIYNMAHKMPVWPYDFGSLARFFSGITLPVLVFVIQMVINTDSIIYNLDKLNIFKIITK